MRQVGPAGASRALRASVQVRRIDPWSTLKISAVLAVIGFFIWMIAVAMLYLLLDGMGVWSQVNSSVSTLTTDGGGSSDAIGAGTVFGWAFLLGIVIALGMWNTLSTALSDVYNYRASVSPWFRSIFMFQPAPDLIASSPLQFQLHAFFAFLLLAIWPFTRLVHVFSAPIGYLARPYIVYRTKGDDTTASQPSRAPQGTWRSPTASKRG